MWAHHNKQTTHLEAQLLKIRPHYTTAAISICSICFGCLQVWVWVCFYDLGTTVNPFNLSHLESAVSLSRKCVCRQFDFKCLETVEIVILTADMGV